MLGLEASVLDSGVANNSLILVENDINPIDKSLSGEDEDAKLQIEEKMLEIARISMEGRVEDIRACIREMITYGKKGRILLQGVGRNKRGIGSC